MPNKSHRSIFDKLTDSSQYTGSHQHRFDPNGKGRGLAGRDRVTKGTGTSDIPYDGGVIRDLSQITRTNLRSSPNQQQRPQSAKNSALRKTKQRCRETSCVNTCSPTSKHGHCSYHMWREKEQTNFPKQVDRVAPSLAETPVRGARASKHKRQMSSLCSKKQCGNDRSKKSEYGLCTYHQWKFEQEQGLSSKNGPSFDDLAEEVHPEKLESPTSNAKDSSSTLPPCVITSCKETRFRMGYCQSHFIEMVQEEAVSKAMHDVHISKTSKSSNAASGNKKVIN